VADPPGNSSKDERANLKDIPTFLAENNEINAEIAIVLLEN